MSYQDVRGFYEEPEIAWDEALASGWRPRCANCGAFVPVSAYNVSRDWESGMVDDDTRCPSGKGCQRNAVSLPWTEEGRGDG